MDPQQVLNEMCSAIIDGDVGSANDYAESLFNWIARGGFHPSIEQAIKYAHDNR